MNESVPVQNYHYLLHPCNTSLVTCCDLEGRANIIAIVIGWFINHPIGSLRRRVAMIEWILD